MARDGYDREIDYLRISVTDRCNLRCIYCVPENRKPPFDIKSLMTAGEIIRIVRAGRKFNVRKVRLTGGEPLLREDIIELVRGIKDTGVPEMSLTTNGTLLSKMAEPLHRAGLDRINVSLDTMNPIKYGDITDGGDIGHALEGIKAAEAAGLSPVKINMVPIRGINDDEITDFAKMTFDKPCHIRFIEFMPSGRTNLWGRERYIPSSEAMERVSRLGALEQLSFKGKGPSMNYRIKGAKGIIGFISPVSHSFCYLCNRLRINAVGKIRPCLFSKTEIDIATPMRMGASDSELERLIALSISIKPEGNYMNHPAYPKISDMSEIGG